MITTLETHRLVLRPLQADDAEAITALIGAWSVIRWLASPPWPYRLEHAHGFIAARAAEPEAPDNMFRVIVRVSTVVGAVAIEPRHGRANLGFWLGEPHWGHGYMTEAATAMVAAFFSVIGDDVDSIDSGYILGNAASARVQKKLGFTEIGRRLIASVPLREDVAHVDTRLLRTTWQARPHGS